MVISVQWPDMQLRNVTWSHYRLSDFHKLGFQKLHDTEKKMSQRNKVTKQCVMISSRWMDVMDFAKGSN